MDDSVECIREGLRVLIQGLAGTAHAQHDGRHGVVIGAFHSTSTGCWPVQVEGRADAILALRPANISLAKLQRKCEPRHFSHLVRGGVVTLLGFGSLVSKTSASKSFAFKNFRIGSITGYQRIFNRSDWINYTWGDSRAETGETCAVALMRAPPSVVSRIALMDVNAGEGLAVFLHRETTYDIFEARCRSRLWPWLQSHSGLIHFNISQVPYVDDNGGSGIALACGECSDEDAQDLWGRENWYSQRKIGQCFYVNPPATPMPMMPERYSLTGDREGPAYPSDCWMPLTHDRHVMDKASGKYLLPVRPWVYPAPGYLRSIYRAHVLAGLAESLLVRNKLRHLTSLFYLRKVSSFQDTTLLMDRTTLLRSYLHANPALKDFVMDCGRFSPPEADAPV